jgi:hypothetical protein
MKATDQIAAHLKIDTSSIKRSEEWASVWFVVIQGKGARFVSKTVVKKDTSREAVLEKLKPFLGSNLERTIIRHLGAGLSPRQMSNMGVCPYPTAVARCRVIATALSAENGSLNKATKILSVLMIKQGGSN